MELVVQTNVQGGLQNATTELERKQIFLEEWEKRLLAREQDLDQREAELSHRYRPTQMPLMPRKMMCDYCGTGRCNRGRFCVDVYGTSLHRHHNCERCHQEWRLYGAKGTGKGSPWSESQP